MIDMLSHDPATIVLGGAAGLTGVVYFIRFIRRMFYGEKRDTSIDLASQSLFENLRLENERMSKQMAEMSIQLNNLAKENHELNMKVAELTISVRMLVTLEKENIFLQDEIVRRDDTIKDLTTELSEMADQLKDALMIAKMSPAA